MSAQIESAPTSNGTTSDERLMAALAHGSVILSFFGPIIPALVWTFQRRKSPYVAFHTLQAIGYQMLTFWVGMAAYLLFILVFMLVAIPLMGLAASSSDFEVTPFILQGSMMFFMFGFMGLYMLFGIVGAVLCLLGKDFKYPVLGKRLEKYLGRGANPNDLLDEVKKEEQWMAAMGHASAILMLWGLMMPLVVWLTQKDSSPRLRFQSIQAVVYQLLAVVGYFAFMALYMFLFFALFFGGMVASQNPQGSTSMVFLLVFLGVILVLMLVFALALPTYHLFAMIAGIQVAKGKDYYYPLLGKFLACRMDKVQSPSAD